MSRRSEEPHINVALLPGKWPVNGEKILFQNYNGKRSEIQSVDTRGYVQE